IAWLALHTRSSLPSSITTKDTKAANFSSSRSSLRDLRALRGSSDIRKVHIGRHTGAQTIVIVRQSNFYAKHLAYSVFDSLHVARGELGMAIDLLDDAVKIRVRKRIDTDPNVIAEFDFTQPRLWNINADPQMLG